MHPKFYAQRNAIAQDRQQAAAKTLAETFGVDAPVAAKDKNPEIARLKEAESLADFLESLAGSAGEILEIEELEDMDLQAIVDSASKEKLEALVGVGPATATKMMEGREERVQADEEEGDE